MQPRKLLAAIARRRLQFPAEPFEAPTAAELDSLRPHLDPQTFEAVLRVQVAPGHDWFAAVDASIAPGTAARVAAVWLQVDSDRSRTQG